MTALEFLTAWVDGTHRIVSTADLTPLQLAEADTEGRTWIDESTGRGYVALPWELTTGHDVCRTDAANRRHAAMS